jgi:hypothetical protein
MPLLGDSGFSMLIMHGDLKARWEAFLIRVAARIVRDRDVHRAMVVSRADNNRMFELGYELDAIAKRIESGYKE